MTRVRLGVVLYRNSLEELATLVRSLQRLEQREVTVEVRFIDNSPDDGLAAPVVAAFGSRAYRRTPSNLGFGAAHNLEMTEAVRDRAEAYVCVNPDALLHPAAVDELWRVAIRPGTWLVDGRTLPEEHPKPYTAGEGETPWCAGTLLLIRAEAISGLGGFDENFFLYAEDVDLSWRVRAAGHLTRTAPRAWIHHWVEHRPLSLERRLEVLRSAAYLGHKWGAPAFARRYERLYRVLAGHRPRLPAVTPISDPARRVADFSHGVRFARSRW